MNSLDKMYLDRLAKGPVYFTHAIDLNGRATKLARSSVSPSLQKHFHRLAVGGYACMTVTGCNGHGNPPETTVTYKLTALGRDALGIHTPPPTTHYRSVAKTDEELAVEGLE